MKANLLLFNLEEVVVKLQSERNFFKTQVEKLQIENKKLFVSNKNLSVEVKYLREKLKIKHTSLV